jgi:hypothetical protein
MLVSFALTTILILPLLSPPLPSEFIIASLEKDYRLEIIPAKNNFLVKSRWGSTWGRAPSANDVQKYLPLLVRELRVYPAELLKKAGIKRIVLCEDLGFDRQYRNAVPDFLNETYYLEIKRGANNPRYLSLVFHHDLFHFIDLRDDGQLYRDERWSSLNPPTFKYGTGGRNAQTQKSTSVLTDQYPGHLNHYSTTGVEEDKAEVYAHLLMNAAYLETRIAKDDVLRRKVERMKELMKAFCPECDEAFWSKSKLQKRPFK